MKISNPKVAARSILSRLCFNPNIFLYDIMETNNCRIKGLKLFRPLRQKRKIGMYKVLLVDDEPYVIEGLKTMIAWERHGFRICGEATNGEDALAIIKTEDPALVITDIRMPVLDGLELIRQSRELLDSKTKFVILSGYEEFSYIQSAMRYDVSDYLLKPIDDEEVNRVIGNLGRQIREERAFDEVKRLSASITGDPVLRVAEETAARALPAGIKPESGVAEGFQNLPLGYDFFKVDIESLLEEVKNNEDQGIAAKIDGLFRRFSRNGSAPEIIKATLKNLELELAKLVLDRNGDCDEISARLTRFNENLAHMNMEKIKIALTELCRYAAGYMHSGAPGNNREIISEIRDFIKYNYAQDITLQKLAKRFYMNPVYLGQLFKKYTGMYLGEYLHRIRIKAAKKLLRRTDMKIPEIARATGYHDPDYFVSKFKAITKVPPSAFRRAANNQ